MERWRYIDGYDGRYLISDSGDVRNSDRKRLLRTQISRNGYKTVTLTKNGKRKTHRIHRLVASAFIENPYNKPFVNHIDNNRQNNSVDNLEWCTAQENSEWSVLQGRNNTKRILGNGDYEQGYTMGYQAGYAAGIRLLKRMERKAEE